MQWLFRQELWSFITHLSESPSPVAKPWPPWTFWRGRSTSAHLNKLRETSRIKVADGVIKHKYFTCAVPKTGKYGFQIGWGPTATNYGFSKMLKTFVYMNCAVHFSEMNDRLYMSGQRLLNYILNGNNIWISRNHLLAFSWLSKWFYKSLIDSICTVFSPQAFLVS